MAESHSVYTGTHGVVTPCHCHSDRHTLKETCHPRFLSSGTYHSCLSLFMYFKFSLHLSHPVQYLCWAGHGSQRFGCVPIPRINETCECGLIWKEALCRCDYPAFSGWVFHAITCIRRRKRRRET
ncbi:hypothetical protein HJG60_008661 [Phyllostomus discolor]|uniref:Uncharacterized protein n=1 Tax=Phyllostomus discolor TaxID=89673 RepID=A0A833YZD3_9CHIR|nr:hypothetical protein HJG60_008661 [Phyllostomus discolor]